MQCEATLPPKSDTVRIGFDFGGCVLGIFDRI